MAAKATRTSSLPVLPVAHSVSSTADRELLHRALQAALAQAHGRTRTAQALAARAPAAAQHVLAVGKAACAMAAGAVDAWGGAVASGLVITKSAAQAECALPQALDCLEGDHPIPGARSLVAGQRLVQFIAGLAPKAPVLCLWSGGASSLVEVPRRGVTLSQLQRLNEWMLASGLDIAAMNALRRRYSRIKGGGLRTLLRGHEVTALMISDVPGDDPAVIGSGPLVKAAPYPEPDGVPEDIRRQLTRVGPSPEIEDGARVSVEVIAGRQDAMRAAANVLRDKVERVKVHERPLQGDAARTGRRLAQTLIQSPPGAYVWSGETTVVLPPNPGRGGRCQHLALAAAEYLDGHDVLLLAVGTDGGDGPGDDAGALVDGGTRARGEAHGVRLQDCLDAADAGGFLEAGGDLIRTGPTGTNVMDLIIGLRR